MKKAITSLIIGLIGLVIFAIILITSAGGLFFGVLFFYNFSGMIIFPVGVIGVLLGIGGLIDGARKSNKWIIRISIAGIVLDSLTALMVIIGFIQIMNFAM